MGRLDNRYLLHYDSTSRSSATGAPQNSLDALENRGFTMLFNTDPNV